MLRAVGQQLDERDEEAPITPSAEHILRAFEMAPDSISAVIVGQDPYPAYSMASGLAFSVNKHVTTLPGTLRNIRQELADDVGIQLPHHGDLSAWATQGVLLVNRHLTTVVGKPGAHAKVGWSHFTDLVVRTIATKRPDTVAVLWGKQAQTLLPLCTGMPTICSAHPSPLSAHRGFLGSKPFSQVNSLRAQRGLPPIDWSLETEA
jgi:uracil-DNA glycosylase